MNITINQVLQSYIDPLTASEYAALERSLLAEGCRDALVLWNDVLIDGHNRYAICRQHRGNCNGAADDGGKQGAASQHELIQ